jgi:hypothetical protein
MTFERFLFSHLSFKCYVYIRYYRVFLYLHQVCCIIKVILQIMKCETDTICDYGIVFGLIEHFHLEPLF